MRKGRNLTKEEAAEMGRKGGRKKGCKSPNTVAKIEAREELRKLIEKDMRELYVAWKDSALGHFVQVKTETGEIQVYKKSPNAIAIRDMFVQAFGNPNQPHSLKIENFCDFVNAMYANVVGGTEKPTAKS